MCPRSCWAADEHLNRFVYKTRPPTVSWTRSEIDKQLAGECGPNQGLQLINRFVRLDTPFELTVRPERVVGQRTKGKDVSIPGILFSLPYTNSFFPTTTDQPFLFRSNLNDYKKKTYLIVNNFALQKSHYENR